MSDDEPRISLPVEPQISYSVKEILTRIESKMDDFVKALAFKADTSSVENLGQRVTHTEDRLTAIEERNKARDETSKWRSEWRRWLIPALMTAALTAASIVALFHH